MDDKYMTLQTKKINQLKDKGGEVMRTAKIVRMPDGSECLVDVFAHCDWIKPHRVTNDQPTNWRTPETAPKTGEQILANVGWPWPVVACWNACDSKWSYANMQVNMVKGEYNDPYFETEQAHGYELKGWMPLPNV